MENKTEKKETYLSGKIGFREILQAVANVAVIYIAYKLYMFVDALETIKTMIK
jgi:hypothetical protein